MKTFDFETCSQSKERTEWLKENHAKPMSEEQFVQEWQARKNHANNPPSKARRNYRTLKRNYGFFQ